MTDFLMVTAGLGIQGHLTLHSILVDIPHDAAAIVVYALSAAAIFWVFKAGLKKPEPDDRTED